MKILLYIILLAPIILFAIPFLTMYLFYDRFLEHKELKNGYKQSKKEVTNYSVNNWAYADSSE
jgi:hypothetical protein